MIYAKIFVRGLGKLLLVLMALAVSLYLLVWAINLKDEALSAESLQLQQILQAQVPVPDQDNGYVYYAKHHAKSLNLPDALRTLSSCATDKCLEDLEALEAELPKYLQQHQHLIDTYLKLQAFPAWQYPLPHITAEIIPFSPLIGMQQLFLLEIWQKVQAGDTVAATSMLQQDLKFWRKQLVISNGVLNKRLAVTQIKQHFKFAEILKNTMEQQQYQQLVPELWRQPFSAEELSLSLAMAGEWNVNRSALQQVMDWPNDGQNPILRWLQGDLWLPFIDVQATTNMFARNNIACILQDPLHANVDYPWYSWLKNPLGKMFAQPMTEWCMEHFEPLFTLEAQRSQLTSQ